MKRFGIFAVAAAIALGASAQGLGDLGKLLGGGSGSTLGDAITGVVGGLFSTSEIEVSQLAGDWKYAGPAVNFKSDNLLKKAGGSAAAGAIEGKMEPYFKKLGLNNLLVEIDADGNFTMKVKKMSVSGTIEKLDGDKSTANFVFHFKAAGRLNVGSMNAYVTLSPGSMSLMFDVSKLISILQTVSSVTGNQQLQTVSGILNSYDGLCAGFKLRK